MKTMLWLAALLAICPIASAETYSALWGANGERWSPESRLPDFSFAGYRRGEVPLPTLPITANVRDFGALGDGQHDDSDAFLQAIVETKQGAILVPEGRYVITKLLVINKPGLVIRGEDPRKAILYFPKPLNEIKPNWGATTSGQRTSNYSWGGGFITIKGSYRRKELAKVVEPAKRGANTLLVNTAELLSVGQEIELQQVDDVTNSFANHLYSGDPRISMEKLHGRSKDSFVTRITTIEGNAITLDRPLRWDVNMTWKPTVNRFAPTVTESGIENLGFEYPNTPYRGHFTELGFNAFTLSQTAHCWVRNIRIHNADSGGFVSGVFNTLDGVVYTSQRKPDGFRKSTGHHGATLGGADNLFTRFDFQTKFIHDLTVSRSTGNVFSNGRGVDLSLDHHCHGPYENLFTNIDPGYTGRLWSSGGGADLGAHCGARGTFWNIQGDVPTTPPDRKFGPWSMNLVGVRMDVPEEIDPKGRWFEHNEGNVSPVNLHEAQLKKRLED